MSEALLVFLVVWVVRRLIRWMGTGDVHDDLVAGVGLGMAYLARHAKQAAHRDEVGELVANEMVMNFRKLKSKSAAKKSSPPPVGRWRLPPRRARVTLRRA